MQRLWRMPMLASGALLLLALGSGCTTTTPDVALAGAGVEPARISAQGYGETRPLAPEAKPDGADDPDGRARNRRVEVVIASPE